MELFWEESCSSRQARSCSTTFETWHVSILSLNYLQIGGLFWTVQILEIAWRSKSWQEITLLRKGSLKKIRRRLSNFPCRVVLFCFHFLFALSVPILAALKLRYSQCDLLSYQSDQKQRLPKSATAPEKNNLIRKLLIICRFLKSTFEDIWGHSRIFEDIWGHLRTLKDIWGHLRTFEDIWEHLRSFKDIKGHLRTFEDIWGYLRTFKDI